MSVTNFKLMRLYCTSVFVIGQILVVDINGRENWTLERFTIFRCTSLMKMCDFILHYFRTHRTIIIFCYRCCASLSITIFLYVFQRIITTQVFYKIPTNGEIFIKHI